MQKILLAILLTLLCATASLAGHYRIASLDVPASHALATTILPTVYARAGHTVIFSLRPAKRAQEEAASGLLDGDALRILSFEQANPTLIRVPTPIYTIEVIAFVNKQTSVNISSKGDLAQYKVGRVRGFKNAELITNDLPDVSVSNSAEHMMLLLEKQRIDVAIFERNAGIKVVEDHNFTNVIPLPVVLASHTLYHYLHKKNADLVPKLDAVLREISSNGELAELVRVAEEKVYRPK